MSGYKNEQNYNIGHIGRVNFAYLGQISSSKKYNPFTDYIDKGLRAYLTEHGLDLDVQFISQWGVDRTLELTESEGK